MDLLTEARELYALPLGEFTPARNARAKDLRREGARELAGAVKELSKPAVAAWVSTMMLTHRADEVEELLALGASLRSAQEEADAADLRELSRQRRRLVSAMVRSARSLAADLGQKVSDAVAADVESTLHAAMTDSGAEAALRSGVLVRAMAATGFGEVDLVGAVAVPEALPEVSEAWERTREPAPRGAGATGREAGAKKGKRAKTGGSARKEGRAEAGGRAERRSHEQELARRRAEAERERRRAERELAAREAEVEGAGQEVSGTEERLHGLQSRTLQLRSEVDELRRTLDERKHELAGTADALTEAEDEHHAAESAYRDAQAAVEEARDLLDRLRKENADR